MEAIVKFLFVSFLILLAVIAYNYFTSKIDTLTYFIDEAGFAISQAYKRAKGSN